MTLSLLPLVSAAFGTGYRAAVALRMPVRLQVQIMTVPADSAVWWTPIDNLALRAGNRAWVQARRGRWWFARELDESLLRPQISVNEPVPGNGRYSITHNTIRQLFLDNEDYQNSLQYQDMLRRIGEKGRSRGCRSAADVDAYFKELKQTFASMRAHGYLSQVELGGPRDHEVHVYFGRDGQLVKLSGGNHRILMAEILGIRWIPFIVRGAHPWWLAGLCGRYDRPPHEAVQQWLTDDDRFREVRPEQAFDFRIEACSDVDTRIHFNRTDKL